MEPLERRVHERMTLEARELRQEQIRLAKRRVTLTKDAEKAHAASLKLFGVLQGGDEPTKAVAGAGAQALKTLAKTAREMLKVNTTMVEHSAMLAKLDDPAERERRMATAKELGASDKPLTGADAAELVLLQREKAMHITDLTARVVESGVVRLTGKTPSQTMSAYLAKEAAKPDGRFVRVAPGVFDLRTRPKTKA